MAEKSTGSQFEKFKNDPLEYVVWKTRVTDELIKIKLWFIVNKPKPTVPDEEFTRATTEAQATIRSHIHKDFIRLIDNNDTVLEIFAKLDQKYKGMKAGPSITWADITKTRFTGEKPIHEHIQRF